MANFDFSTLGSSDLEDLVCDLLNADLPAGSKVRYKTFKDGKDKGIDFLYDSMNHRFDHVGQVKHYYKTGFSGLLTHLTKTEVAKVKKLKPNRYILATSVDLSVSETEKIAAAFSPFIKSLNDIYGKKNLNMLLSKHEAVLNRHFKLWFCDTAVLKKILAADLYYRTADFVESELTRRIRIFVQPPVMQQAKACLDENNFVVITGEPGVGKTTLAEMLTYSYLKDDYQLLYIQDDIKEVERFLENNDSKQIIYFDDFLGSNSVEINKAQGSETALVSIVKRIKRRPNKRLIFTTRKHILSTVMDQSEKLQSLAHGEAVFNLTAYTWDMKAQLLQNHIDDAQIDPGLKSVLQERHVFNFIVGHHSFNPRSVEFITRRENVETFSPSAYKSFIVENFNNPREIWSHAYRNQIGKGERLLLNTLLTFKGGAEYELLENAFNHRVKLAGIAADLSPTPFKTAYTRLEKGFIINRKGKVDFINPSLRDFIKHFLESDPHEVQEMINSVRYIHQLAGDLRWLSSDLSYLMSPGTKTSIISDLRQYLRPYKRDHDLAQLAVIADSHFNENEQRIILVEALSGIEDWREVFDDYSFNVSFLEFLNLNRKNRKIQKILSGRSEGIIDDMFFSENDVSQAINRLGNIKELLDLDFSTYDLSPIIKHLDHIFPEYISNEAYYLREHLFNADEAYDKMDEIRKLVEQLSYLGIEYSVNMSEFNINWEEIARENEFRRQMDNDD